jgi:5-methylcytosine-specific restriction protein A
MSTHPLRSCRKSGCATLVQSGYCIEHAASQRKVYDQQRGTAAARGYDGDWEKVRIAALERDKYLCLHCLAKGIATPAKDVDHIRSISQAPELRLDIDNLQSLCRTCHAKKTTSERQIHGNF